MKKSIAFVFIAILLTASAFADDCVPFAITTPLITACTGNDSADGVMMITTAKSCPSGVITVSQAVFNKAEIVACRTSKPADIKAVTVSPSDNATDVAVSYSIKEDRLDPSLVDTYNQATKRLSSPVSIVTESGAQLITTEFSVKKIGTDRPIAATLVEPRKSFDFYLGENMAMLVAQDKFEPHTTYEVLFVGKQVANGVTTPVVKTWSFTTGS